MKTPVVLTDLESKTPAEIDAVLFDLDARLQSILRQIADHRERLRDEKLSPNRRLWLQGDADRYIADHASEVAQLHDWIAPLLAEFKRRGGWARFTYCHSYGGHYHRGADCHTTRGSALTWVADLSGLDDNAVIERVGYHACSQDECFPTAPLHPAWAISEQRDRDAQAAAREYKYAKGLATRQKRIANIQKRIAKATEKVARYADATDPNSEAAALRSYAESDLKFETQSLQSAQRELDRWIAKRSNA